MNREPNFKSPTKGRGTSLQPQNPFQSQSYDREAERIDACDPPANLTTFYFEKGKSILNEIKARICLFSGH